MRLVYKYRVNDKELNHELLRLCRVSKDLYNQALYTIRQNLEKEDKFLFYQDTNKLMQMTTNLEGNVNYRLLKAQVAQQVLRQVDSVINSYIKSVKDWSKNKEKYTGKPELPRYKRKKGYNLLTYTNQCCSIRDGYVRLSKELLIPIPQWEDYKKMFKTFHQVRVLPKRDLYCEIEIIYDSPEMNLSLDFNKVAGLDLGVDNLVTMVGSDIGAVIYNGKQIKSLNRYFNKEIGKLKSEIERVNGHKSSKRIRSLWDRRERQLDDVMHKLSRHIVNTCLRHNIGKLVLGYNSGWKDSISIGTVNNQNFVQIPYDKLRRLLSYKCQLCGIELVVTEENYTSKCDGLAFEEICKHDSYLGKRVKRGLFQSSTGRLLNADVNGAFNILRKVVNNSAALQQIVDSGRLFRPVKLVDLWVLQVI